jgi:hypothetical protein
VLPLFSISQNPAKVQALAALPPVAALCSNKYHTYQYQKENAMKFAGAFFFNLSLGLNTTPWSCAVYG